MIAAFLDDHDQVEKVENLRPLSPTFYTTSAEYMAEVSMVLPPLCSPMASFQKIRSQGQMGTIYPLATQHLQQTNHCCKVPESVTLQLG